MTGYQDIKDILEKAVGGTDIGAHGNFWRGLTRDQFVQHKVFGRQLLMVGNPTTSNIVHALRGQAPFGQDVVPRPPGALLRRMPAGWPAVPEASIQVIEAWIGAGCPDVAPAAIARERLAAAAVPGDDRHVRFWREFDQFFLFEASPQTSDSVNVFMGECMGAWIGYAMGATDKKAWTDLISVTDKSQAVGYLAAQQRRLLELHYGSPAPQQTLFDSYWKFGGDLLPDDPLRPREPRHRMDGSTSWFAWAAFVDAIHFLSPGDDHWTAYGRALNVGIVADGVLRSDPERQGQNKIRISDFSSATPNVGAAVTQKYGAASADECVAELIRRCRESGLFN